MSRRPVDESPYQCFLCTFEGPEVLSLRSHIERDHSRSNYFWCKWCGKATSCLDEHLKHLQSEQCTDTIEHPCGFEGCSFSDHKPSIFINHLRTEHKGIPLMPCVYCKRLFTLPPCLVTHIQNDCCNRPTSSSSLKGPSVPTREEEASCSQNNHETAVSSSTSKPTKCTENVNKNKQKGNLSPEKQKDKSKSTFSLPSPRPTWNPFGMNKDFMCANDSDSTASTRSSNENLKSTANSSKYQKRKSPEAANNKTKKRLRPCDAESSESENFVNCHVFNTWADWLHKMQKFKTPDDVEVFLKRDRAQHFFRCMYKSCTFSSHDTTNFILHYVYKHKAQKLKCFYCFTTFDYAESLVKHMVSKHIDRRWQCNSCLYRACSKTQVKVHQQMLHGGEDVEIIQCQRAEAGGLQEGSTRKTKPRVPCSYNCRVSDCKFSTLITQDFRNHLLEMHNSISYFTCCYCSFETTKLEQLVSHYRRHDMNNYECGYCTFGAELYEDVLMHVCINHADNQIEIVQRSNEPIDPNKAENVLNRSGNSVSSENGTSVNIVPNIVENNNTSDDKELRAKRSSPSSSKQSPTKTPSPSKSEENVEFGSDHLRQNHFACKHCDKTYRYEKRFKSHYETSHNIKLNDSYGCPLCDLTSLVSSKIRAHAKLFHPGHTVEVVNLKMKSPKNNKKKDKENKEIEKQIISKTKKNFVCVFCDTSFESESFLIDHLYSEIEYQKYSCKVCNFKHYNRKEIERHFKSEHNDSVPLVVCTENQIYEDWIFNYVSVQKRRPSNVLCIPMPRLQEVVMGELSCKMCKRQYPTQDRLKYHIFEHLQYFPHQCTTCKQKFTNSAETEDHSKMFHHTTKRSTKLTCKKIDKIEQWVSELLNPMSTDKNSESKKTDKRRKRFPSLERSFDEQTDTTKTSPEKENPKPPNNDTGSPCSDENMSEQHETGTEDIAKQQKSEKEKPTGEPQPTTNIEDRTETEGNTLEDNEDADSEDNASNDRFRAASPIDFGDDMSEDDYELPDIGLAPSPMSNLSDSLSENVTEPDNQEMPQTQPYTAETDNLVKHSPVKNSPSITETAPISNDKALSPASVSDTIHTMNTSFSSPEHSISSTEFETALQDTVNLPGDSNVKLGETIQMKQLPVSLPEFVSTAQKTLNHPGESNTELGETSQMKRTARKSFRWNLPTRSPETAVQKTDNHEEVSIVKYGEMIKMKRTARKSCSNRSPDLPTVETGPSSGFQFKPTARKSTSKPARNHRNAFHRRKHFKIKQKTLDLSNVFYVPVEGLKMASHLFSSIVPESQVTLTEMKSIPNFFS